MADDDVDIVNVKGRYERLETNRFTWLDRARQCAELTIPTLIPPLGHTKTTKYYTPWQGVGARGVNNLAAKLMLALLPPNSPFFRLMIDDFTKDQLTGDPKKASLVDEGLAKVERAVQAEIEGSGIRSAAFLSLKHLIVGGNVFCYLPQEGGMRVFGLDSFVARRDPKGTILEIITKEVISPDTDEKGMLDQLEDASDPEDIEDKKEGESEKKDKDPEDETVELFTRFYRAGNKWRMYQYAMGKEIPDSDGVWPIDKPPFMVLRWNVVEGEDYGRGYVEEYLGDLISLEGLSKAIVEAAASAAKTVWLVNPNGVTKDTDITEAESGDVIVGHKDDVHCLQAEKQADLSIAYQAVQTITQRLAYAFLMNSAIQRNGERVTAEEIRLMAGDLEDALGGVYSILSQEFQLPLVVRLMDRMTRQKRLPELPKGIVKPAIVTGLEALGRGHDVNKLVQFGQALAQALGPAAMQYINPQEYISRMATAMMIDPAGLVKTADDIAQEQAQAQQMAMRQQAMDIAGKAAPAVVKGASDMIQANAGQQQGPSVNG